MARAHGIDISYSQEFFDVDANRADIQFIIIRVSNGVKKDSKFDQFVEDIADVPIRGAYHYFRSERSPAKSYPEPADQIWFPWKDQAKLFLECVQGKGFHFYALDYERNSIPMDSKRTVFRLDNIVDDSFAENAQAWMRYVAKETGKPVLIYTNAGLYQPWMNEWPLWIAQWPAKPNRDKKPDLSQIAAADWKFWQYWAEKPPNRKAKEYGVSDDPQKNVDLNVFNGTLEEMRQWLKRDTVEEPTKPDKPTESPAEDTDVPEDIKIITWNDVRSAARKVARRRDAVASTWFREAGIRDEMKDKSRRKKPYDGKPIKEWQVSPSEDRDEILAEILKQLGKKQEDGGGGNGAVTWGDVRAATRAVAERHGLMASSWFREAGIRDEMKDRSRRKRPYDGKPVEEWPISPSTDRSQILAEILEHLGKTQRPSARIMADVTWGDVREAVEKVARRRGALPTTWFREAGIRDEMKNESLRDAPYEGKPINQWPVTITIQSEIIRELNVQIGPIKTKTPGPSGDQVKLDVPFISQRSKEADGQGRDCGPTCLAMVIRAEPAPSNSPTVNELYDRYLRGHNENTQWGDLRDIAKGEGLNPKRSRYDNRNLALEDVRSLIRKGHPVIVLVNYAHWPSSTTNGFDGNHFVLVTGFDESNVYLHDPLFKDSDKGKHYRLDNATFLNGWDGFAPGGNAPLRRMAMTDKVIPFLSG